MSLSHWSYWAVSVLIVCVVAVVDSRDNAARPDHLFTGGKAIVLGAVWPLWVALLLGVGFFWTVGKLGHLAIRDRTP